VVWQDGRMVGIIGDQWGAIWGKWRILDGKEDEWSDLIFRAPRWQPPPMSIMARVGYALMNKHLKCTGTYVTYGIPKLSSFMCHRVGRYPTSLWMLYGIVSGHPRCVRRGIHVEDSTRVR
jgi:hypothetical protein